MSGRVVTFYSYKGGVGRSMALANIAALLAGRGRRVLCVDWDLEAAGLHAWFAGRLPVNGAPTKGLLDVVDGGLDWKEAVLRVDLGESGGHVDLLPAGSGAPDYVERLQALDWSRAYAESNLGAQLETLRQDWVDSYDLVLLDSRTGLSDIGGICTIQMPDVLVMLFAANRQSLDGTLDVARRARLAREDLPVNRGALMVLPVPSRFEGRTEVEQAQRWLTTFADELAPLYHNWLDRTVGAKEILRHTRIPAVPRWSFEESLPVMEEDRSDPDTISYALEGLSALLDRELADTSMFVGARSAYISGPADFGLRSSNGNPTAKRLAAALREKGHSVRWFGSFLTPEGSREVAANQFARSVRVVVYFPNLPTKRRPPFRIRRAPKGMRSTERLLRSACEASGAQFVIALPGPEYAGDDVVFVGADDLVLQLKSLLHGVAG